MGFTDDLAEREQRRKMNDWMRASAGLTAPGAAAGAEGEPAEAATRTGQGLDGGSRGGHASEKPVDMNALLRGQGADDGPPAGATVEA